MTTFTVLLVAPPAMAASITVTDLTQPGFLIGAEARKAVFGINMTDASGTATFDGLTVELTDVGGDGDFDLADLNDLEVSPDGVAVYRDEGTLDDALDSDDTLVSAFGHDGSGGVSVTVTSTIPEAAEGDYTYFLTVQTSSTISNGDDFTVGIPSVLLGCAFETTPATSLLACPAPDTTETITADTSSATATLSSTPTTLDGNVVWSFSEDVVGVSEDNVVLRLDGSSTNIAAAVTYDSVLHKATINPDASLTAGATYDTIVNPASASDLVTDEEGNPVALTPEEFTLVFGFTPGLVRGNLWYLSNDFDGDHDIPAFGFGGATDFPVVGDWNGDGTMTPGAVRGNLWYLGNDFDGDHDIPGFGFGRATDYPVVGDWDGNGTMTPGLVRGNVWYLSNDFDGDHDIPAFGFGRATDFPVVGDWDDDVSDKMTPGLVRGNVWYLSNDFDGDHDIPAFGFGRATDFPVAGDWDDDGDASAGMVRGNLWYLNNDSDGTHDVSFAFGRTDDIPIAGDWDGAA